jgi:four helix bundle protein
MHNFKQLRIWQKAMALVKDLYHITSDFPKGQEFELKSQMQRAAISIPSNIAEGAGRGTDNEFKRFLQISNGSCCELETQILISEALGFIDKSVSSALLEKINEIQKMNYVLRKKLLLQ